MKGGKYAKTLAKIQIRGIFRIRNGDAMLVLIRMGTNMTDGNQQKQMLPSFAITAGIYSSRNS